MFGAIHWFWLLWWWAGVWIFSPIFAYEVEHRWDFYGDQPLNVYLEYICREPFSPKLVVVQDQDHRRHESSFHFQFLRQIQCPFVLWKNMSTPDLTKYLTEKFKFDPILLLYDVKKFDVQQEFRDHIIMMDRIYSQCSNCEPFICLFDLTIQVLHEWSQQAFIVGQNLRSIMVSVMAAGNDGNAIPSVVLFRPIINGCLMVAGIFQPKSGADFRLLRQPYQECDLNATTIKVAINNIMPFCQIKRFNTNGVAGGGGGSVPEAEISLHDSVEWHLLNLFETKFNFKTKLLDAKNHWGTLVNGTWNGAVAMILNQTADFAICAVSDTIQRRMVVDFSYYVWFDRSTFVTVMDPEPSGPGWNDIQPSVKLVWLCNLAAFVAVAIFIASTAKLIRHNHSFGALAFNLYASFLRQQLNKFTYRRQIRFIFVLWIVASMVLCTGYIGYFYSLVTVPRFRTIDTAQDVLNAIKYGTHHIVVQNSTSYHNMFLHAEPDNQIMYAIGQYFNSTPEPMAANQDELLERLKRFDTIAILPKFATEVVWGTRDPSISPIHSTDYTIASDYTSVMLKKRSTLAKPFNFLIIRCHEYGHFSWWIQNVLLKIYASSSAKPVLEPLYRKKLVALFDGIEDFMPIFTFYLFWMFIAAIVLTCELFYFLFKRWFVAAGAR